MPYQYLSFSDLFEEELRPSAPSSPVLGASSSLGFLLPANQPTYFHHKMALSPSDADRVAMHASSSSSNKRDSSRHRHTLCKTTTYDSHTASSSSSSSSSSSLHLDFLKVWKRRSSKPTSTSLDSALSTPTSSRRSSFTSQGFGFLHPASAASSANTSPAISRQVTKVSSDYDLFVQRTARAEQDEERQRQLELEAYLLQASQTGLSLRRM